MSRIQHVSRLALAVAAAFLLVACQDVPDNRMVGTLERDRVELAVERDEPIVDIPVEDGQTVRVGTVLLRLDPARSGARLERARAERDQAAARLAELRRGPRPEDIEQARAELAASQALLRRARADLEREQTLFDRGLGEAQARDTRQAQYDDAAAQLQARRQVLERLLNGTTVEELEQAEAALAALEAGVALADLELERLEVKAPVDGQVDRVLYEPGERPPPGAVVAVLLDSTRPFARIYVPEPLRAQITPGTVLEVMVDGVADPLEGTVRWVSTDASFTPYFALTEHDRSRLAYLAEVDLPDAIRLPTGVPLVARLP